MSSKSLKNSKIKTEAETTVREKYVLKLFVSGNLPNSARAIININEICEKYLKDRVQLEIIDIYQQPSLALHEQIIAVPILVKKFPLPEVRLIGDLSNIESVLRGLDLI